jgi:hypothetical protein
MIKPNELFFVEVNLKFNELFIKNEFFGYI